MSGSRKYSDLAAERALLGAIVFNDKYLAEAYGVLDGESFTVSNGRLIWYAMEALFQRGQRVDKVSLYERLASSPMTSAEEAEDLVGGLGSPAPSDKHVTSYIRAILNCQRQRKIRSISQWFTEAAGAAEDPDELLTDLHRRLGDVQDVTAGEPVPILEAALEASERTRALREDGVPRGLDIGLKSLKEASALRRGTLTIVGARTNVGKTDFAVMAAMGAASRGGRTLFVSMEMSRSDIVDRMAASIAGVNSRRLHRVEDVDRVEAAYREVSRWPLLIWDVTRRLHVEQLRAAALRIHVKEPLELIVVDYLQLMRGDKKEIREAQVAQCTRGLKILSMELSIPVIALAQVNREAPRSQTGSGPEAVPHLHHLRESGAIEQDADMVIMLDRPWMRDDRADKRLMYAYARKSRHSELFRLDLDYECGVHRIRERD